MAEVLKVPKLIRYMKNIVSSLNKRKSTWSFLTSIEYMLESKLYVDSLYSEAREAAGYLHREDRVLDLGTGSGIFALILNDLVSGFKIFGIDTTNNKSQKDPNFNDTVARQREVWSEFTKKYKVKFSHFDGCHLPYPPEFFSAVTACAVVEHVSPEDLEILLLDVKRVLKKNGLLFVFKLPRKWSWSEFWSRLLGIGKHERLFSDSEGREMFLKEGFLIRKYWRSDLFFEFPPELTNPIFPFLKFFELIFNHFPFNLLAHHNNFVLQKC